MTQPIPTSSWKHPYNRKVRRPQKEVSTEQFLAMLEKEALDPFPENPCRRLIITNNETGDSFSKACDSKRCPDCGPRKLRQLVLGLRELGKLHAATVSLDDLERFTATLRQHRKRMKDPGLSYAAWETSPGEWFLVTNHPEALETSMEVIPHNRLHQWVREAYLMLFLPMRKAWNAATVTLYRRPPGESVTGRWSVGFGRGSRRPHDDHEAHSYWEGQDQEAHRGQQRAILSRLIREKAARRVRSGYGSLTLLG